MMRMHYILTGVAALYFGALIGLSFVPGSVLNLHMWASQVLAFLPVGVLLLLVLGRRRWWAALAFSMLGAAWIEAAQSVWMPADFASTMDVVWASAGASAGVLIAFLFTDPRLSVTHAHEPHRIVAQAVNREIPLD